MAEGGLDANWAMDTLVKYNNPVLVVKHSEKKRPKTATENKSAAVPQPLLLPPPPGSAPPAAGTSQGSSTDEILQSILPPKIWEENGNMWMQTVSSTPASRQEVINLQELLDAKLEQSQARETGICPVRRELYMQCFGKVTLHKVLTVSFIDIPTISCR